MNKKYTLRMELLEYISGLKDRNYQMNCWVNDNCPSGIQHDNFELAVSFLFDDTNFAKDPSFYLGKELHSVDEVNSIENLCREINDLLDELGMHKTDLEYINNPRWENVINKAIKAHALLTRFHQKID